MNTQKIKSISLATGLLLIAKEIVFYCAFYTLGTAIQWPSSLNNTTEHIFLLISENNTAVFFGYYTYLIASLLFIPIVYSFRILLKDSGKSSLLLDSAVGFAIVSVVMRALGILRWLYVVPSLSEAFFDPNSSDMTKEMLLLNYESIDNYAGVAGEHLGVQLLGAVFIGAIGVQILTTKKLPLVFGYWALIASFLFLPIGNLLAIEQGVWLTINGIIFSTWSIVLGVYLILNYYKSQFFYRSLKNI